MGQFAGQVVAVTGAGRGLGAAYAKLLADQGASVLVHDAGVDHDGSGGDPAVAQAVAEEITHDGGRAVSLTGKRWTSGRTRATRSSRPH